MPSAHEDMPPTPLNSPTSPKEPLPFTDYSATPEDSSAPEVPTIQHFEDVRHHQDFSEHIENDARLQPRVRLPGQENYFATVPNSQEGYYEEGEIDEVGGLDGADLGDVDLDELLELEEDGADTDLYRQLEDAVPSSFTAYPEQSLPAFENFMTDGSRSSMFSLWNPPLPPIQPSPGINFLYPDLERTEAWITSAEYLLSQDPRYSPYRVKKPSGLRTCWVPKVTEGSDWNGSIIL